ncbi:MAG: hypothetical protein PVG32_21350 [Anaerolineales bacterium]
MVEKLVVGGVVVGRAGHRAGQHSRDPGVAPGQVVQGLATVGVLDALAGTQGYPFLVGAPPDDITHMAVLAHADVVAWIGSSKGVWRERSDPRSATLLTVRREHELREGALHMEVGRSGVQFCGERLRRICAQISQDRVGDVVAGAAEEFALVIAAVEHLVPGSGVGEGGAFFRVRTDEVLPRTVLGVTNGRQVASEKVPSVK